MAHQTYIELPDGGYAIAHGDQKPLDKPSNVV